MSETWQHFRRLEGPNERAECIICSARLSCRGSSTSGLIRHLTNRHRIHVNMYVKNTPKPRHPRLKTNGDGTDDEKKSEKRKYKKSKLDLGKDDPIIVMASPNANASSRALGMNSTDKVTRLIALYDVTCKALLDQSMSMINRGLNKQTILDLINTQYEYYKMKTIASIKTLKAKQARFSLGFDIWLSYKDRCFISIDLYTHDFQENLGLLRVNVHYDGARMFTCLNDKLNEYELDLMKDVIGITSNCPDVVSIVRNLEFATSIIHHRCYSDLIHTCLLNVFFKDTEEIQGYAEEESDDEDNFSDCSDFNCEPLNKGVHFVLFNIRKIVKFFRIPENQAILQTIVAKKLGKNVELVLDNEKNWASIDLMVERFLALYECLNEAYKEINSSDLPIEEVLLQVKEVRKTLELMLVTLKALEKPEMTLVRSETVLAFMFKNLTEQNSDIALNLYRQLQQTIQMYRNHNLISVMKFLMNKNMTSTHDLPIVDQQVINECIKKYSERFVDLKNITFSIKKDDEPSLTGMDLMERLEQEIYAGEAPSTPKFVYNQNDVISKELAVYHNNDVLGENLTSLFENLKTIRPSCTNSKTVFSTARQRSFNKWPGLSTETRNKLWFLRHQYKKEK